MLPEIAIYVYPPYKLYKKRIKNPLIHVIPFIFCCCLFVCKIYDNPAMSPFFVCLSVCLYSADVKSHRVVYAMSAGPHITDSRSTSSWICCIYDLSVRCVWFCHVIWFINIISSIIFPLFPLFCSSVVCSFCFVIFTYLRINIHFVFLFFVSDPHGQFNTTADSYFMFFCFSLDWNLSVRIDVAPVCFWTNFMCN